MFRTGSADDEDGSAAAGANPWGRVGSDGDGAGGWTVEEAAVPPPESPPPTTSTVAIEIQQDW